jgi:hypothetical protein
VFSLYLPAVLTQFQCRIGENAEKPLKTKAGIEFLRFRGEPETVPKVTLWHSFAAIGAIRMTQLNSGCRRGERPREPSCDVTFHSRSNQKSAP